MFTLLLNWLKPLIIGFGSAWSWLITPIIDVPTFSVPTLVGGVFVNFTWPAWTVSPISVISIGGFAVLFMFGIAKTVMDALPLV